jgi:hypothetical protein
MAANSLLDRGSGRPTQQIDAEVKQFLASRQCDRERVVEDLTRALKARQPRDRRIPRVTAYGENRAARAGARKNSSHVSVLYLLTSGKGAQQPFSVERRRGIETPRPRPG